jgi:hypothetical protein
MDHRWVRPMAGDRSPDGARSGQSAAPSTLLLFRTLRRVHAMRSDLRELLTRGERSAKVVHIRSASEMTRWLGEATRQVPPPAMRD